MAGHFQEPALTPTTYLTHTSYSTSRFSSRSTPTNPPHSARVPLKRLHVSYCKLSLQGLKPLQSDSCFREKGRKPHTPVQLQPQQTDWGLISNLTAGPTHQQNLWVGGGAARGKEPSSLRSLWQQQSDWGQVPALTASPTHLQNPIRGEGKESTLQVSATAAPTDRLGTGIWLDCRTHLPTKVSQKTTQGEYPAV